MSLRPLAFMVDIDGTVADLGHRLHHIQKTPKDWDGFHGNIHLDKPIPDIIRIVQALGTTYPIAYCTGRNEALRMKTEAWLQVNVPVVQPTYLYMRPNKDYRHDYIVKKELFLERIQEDFQIVAVLEDRTQVVDMWRQLGLTTLQVADGLY